MSFPDYLPTLSEEHRDWVNRSLIAKLARILGWSWA